MQLKSLLNKDHNSKELFKGGFIALVFKGLSMVIGVLFMWILNQWLSTDAVGVFSTAWTILMIGTVVGKLGYDTSIVKFIAGAVGQGKAHQVKDIYRTNIKVVFVAASIVAGIVFLFAPLLNRWFFDSGDYTLSLRVIALSIIPLSIMNINAESMKSLKNITAFSIFQNSSIYLLIIALLFCIKPYGLNNSTSLYTLGIGVLIIFGLSFIALKKNFETRLPQNVPSNDKYKFNLNKNLKISIPMMLTNSLFLIMSWMDILMIGAFKTDADVGIYNISLKISAVISTSLIAINAIALPKFAELYEKENKRFFKKIVRQTSFFNFTLSLPIFLLIIIIPSFLLQIFGEEYLAGKTTLIILAFGQIFCAFSGATIHVLNMTNYEKLAQNIFLSTAILNFFLNFFLVPRYGINGAAIATASSTIIWNVMAEIAIYKKLGFLTYPFITRKQIKEIKSQLSSK